jgi:MFS family permease
VNDKAGQGLPGPAPPRLKIVTVLGLAQILAFGSTYYLPAVLAVPISGDTGWPLPAVVAGLSLGMLVAGAVSPRVGAAIDRRGGRPILAVSSILFAAGLACVGLAPSLPVYLAGWAVIGLGMAAGLYEACFGALGKYYGKTARGAIGSLTLFGGFASTICWPLSAFLVEAVGWRGACLAYAGLHLAVALPAYLVFLPATAPLRPLTERGDGAGAEPALTRPQLRSFWLLALVITLASFISAVISVHLLAILQLRGLELAAAVSLGALVGPSQVTARAVEMALGRFYHPTWTLLASVTLMAAGIALLWGGFAIAAVALVVYGAGLGIESIAKGTVPLALFGPGRYATLMGRMALPSLVAQAAAPFLAALILEWGGPDWTLAALAVLAAANVALAAALIALCRARP